MAAVVIEFSGDEAKLVRSMLKQQDEFNKLGTAGQKASEKITEANKRELAVKNALAEAEKRQQALLKQGEAITKSLMTPQEKFNAGVREAALLRSKQAISEETHIRIIKRLQAELKESTKDHEALAAAERKQKQAEKELADEMKKAEAIVKRNTTALEQLNEEQQAANELKQKGLLSVEAYNREVSRINDEKTKIKESSDELVKKNTLLGQAANLMSTYATTVGPAAAAVMGIKAAWEQVNAEQSRGLEGLEGQKDTDRRLLQVSDNAEQFTANRQQRDQLAMQFGVDRNVVGDVLFNGISDGFKEFVPDIIAANQVIAPQAAATVAGKAPALFQGQVNPMEAIGMTLMGAKQSNLDFEDIASVLPSAAEGGSIAKASPEETIATLSTLASRFKSGDVAADRIKAFSAVAGIDQGNAEMGRPSLAGKGIVGAVEALQAMPEEQRTDFLGKSQELNVAYTVLVQELATIKERQAQLEAERVNINAGGGLLKEQIGIANNDAVSTAVREKAIAQITQEVAETNQFGIQGARAAGAQAMATANLAQNGSLAQRTAGSLVGGTVATVGVSMGQTQAEAAETATGTANVLGDFSSGGIGAIFTGIGSRMAKASTDLEKAAEITRQAAEANQAAPPPPNAIRAQAKQGESK